VEDRQKIKFFEISIRGEITTSPKLVVSVVCQPQGRAACRHPTKVGTKLNGK